MLFADAYANHSPDEAGGLGSMAIPWYSPVSLERRKFHPTKVDHFCHLSLWGRLKDAKWQLKEAKAAALLGCTSLQAAQTSSDSLSVFPRVSLEESFGNHLQGVTPKRPFSYFHRSAISQNSQSVCGGFRCNHFGFPSDKTSKSSKQWEQFEETNLQRSSLLVRFVLEIGNFMVQLQPASGCTKTNLLNL